MTLTFSPINAIASFPAGIASIDGLLAAAALDPILLRSTATPARHAGVDFTLKPEAQSLGARIQGSWGPAALCKERLGHMPRMDAC